MGGWSRGLSVIKYAHPDSAEDLQSHHDRAIRDAHMRVSARRQVRHLLEWAVPPRLRLHMLRVAAFAFPSQVGPQGFLRMAAEFGEKGRMREAMLCWRILHDMAPADTRIVMKRVSCAIEAGNLAEIDHALEDSAAGAGIPPHALVRFAGQLVQHGHMRGAGRMLTRLADVPGAERLISQSPSIISATVPNDIRLLGETIASARPDSRSLLPLARLCFTFRNPRVAAVLFAQASTAAPLDTLDRVAMMHALAEADSAALQGLGVELRTLAGQLSANPEALGMVVKIALVAGEMDTAREALQLALRLRYGEGGQVPIDDCLATLEVLAALRDVGAVLPSVLLERVEERAGGVPKVFLCGFGWSGSGALYDEIRGVPGFCEFEGAGIDAIINEDADSEVTFVQGPGGLGDLWLQALRRGSISWHSLWETFNLHVAGLSSIGYAQYKCAAAARNHVRRYGGSYTRPFRNFLEEYAKLRRDPRPGALHARLLEATESLCSMLVQYSGARAVLFNNAVFGRDAAMLEIFRSRQAAIVYRDPRDVYVDRRDKDLNHWRTSAQLAAFYAYGLRRYTDYKLGRGESDPSLREVPFERFVKNDRFRARVRAWLLGELVDLPSVRHFDPALSRRNIGIHVGALTPTEQAQLQSALDDCRILDRFSDAAWGAGV